MAGNLKAFLSALEAPCVLIRLDERGGDDEPATWAFHGAPKSVRLPPRDDENIDVEALRDTLHARIGEEDEPTGREGRASIVASDEASDERHPWVSPDDETVTAAPAPPRTMPLPPARGAATVYLAACDKDAVVIGREGRVHIAIDERSISKIHARLRLKDDTFEVIDLGSSNGTKVNGRAVVPGSDGKLTSGDVLTLGDVELLFLDSETLFARLPELAD